VTKAETPEKAAAPVQAADADAALDKLRPIAADNLTLAQEIRRWQAQSRP